MGLISSCWARSSPSGPGLDPPVSDNIEPNVQTWLPTWCRQLDDHPTALCWRDDGALLAVSSLSGDVLALDPSTGTDSGAPIHHAGGTLCLAWSAASLVTGGQDGSFTIDGSRHHVGGWVNDLAVSTNGDVAIAHGRHVSLAGRGVIATHSTTVTSLAWHPTAKSVAAGSFGRVSWVSIDDNPNDGNDGQSTEEVELPWGGAVAALRIAEDSDWAAAGVRGDWGYVWRIDDPAPALALPVGGSTGLHVGFSADGSQLALATPKMVAAFDLGSTDPLGQPAGQWLSSVGGPTALCWHPTSELLVIAVSTGSGERDNGLLVWQPRRAPAPLGFVSTTSPVTHVAWSPDGNTLALATQDGVVSIAEDPFDLQ